ncbi:hypothetical protein SESBI_07184 [Sesbania bispinosa]|nr:hypothetical protein SESBI_07184 [Sesbania bispinosa]
MDFHSGNSSIWYKDWTGLAPLCNLPPFVHITDTQKNVKDIWKEGTWDFSGLYTSIPQEVQNHISSIPIPQTISSEPDMWCWGASLDFKYNVRSGYKWLQDQQSVLPHYSFTSDIFPLMACAHAAMSMRKQSSTAFGIVKLRRNNFIFSTDRWSPSFVVRQALLMHAEFPLDRDPEDADL